MKIFSKAELQFIIFLMCLLALQDAVEVCKIFMARDPQEVRFTIIALSKESYWGNFLVTPHNKENITAKHSQVLTCLEN